MTTEPDATTCAIGLKCPPDTRTCDVTRHGCGKPSENCPTELERITSEITDAHDRLPSLTPPSLRRKVFGIMPHDSGRSDTDTITEESLRSLQSTVALLVTVPHRPITVTSAPACPTRTDMSPNDKVFCSNIKLSFFSGIDDDDKRWPYNS